MCLSLTLWATLDLDSQALSRSIPSVQELKCTIMTALNNTFSKKYLSRILQILSNSFVTCLKKELFRFKKH